MVQIEQNKETFNLNKQIKRTAKDSLVYLPARIIPAVIGIALIRILTGLLSPTDYGYYQITLSTFGLIRVFSMIWLSTSVTRFYLNYEKKNETDVFLSSLFLLSLISSVILALISFFINKYFFSDKLLPVLYHLVNLAIVASIFNTIFEVFVVVFRAGLRAKFYSIFWILFSVGKPIIGILLIVLFDFKADGIFWGFLITPLFLNIFMLYQLKVFSTFSLKKFSTKIFSSFFKYGTPLSISFLAFWILSLSDRYLIGYFENSTQVGLYSVGYLISEKTLNFIYMIIMLAAYPIIIDNWEKHGEQATQQLITGISRYFFMVCIPILVVLVVIPDKVLLFFSDEKFLAGAKVLPLIAIGVFFNGLVQYVQKGLELHKKSIKIAQMALISGITNVSLNIVLIPKYGILGAGFSVIIAYGVYFILAYLFTKNLMKWIPPFRSIINILTAGLILGLFLLLLDHQLTGNGFIYLFIPVSFVLYLVVLFLSRELKTNELVYVFIYFKRIFQK